MINKLRKAAHTQHTQIHTQDDHVQKLPLPYTLKLSPHPHDPFEFGFLNVNSADNSVSCKDVRRYILSK